jgi:hypothetical protein
MRNYLCIAIGLTAGLLGGCAQQQPPPQTSATKMDAAAAAACEATQPIEMRLPEGFDGEPSGDRLYPMYANADRSILWLAGGPFVAGERAKRWWFRPAGEDLVVTGRRIDAAAPPAAFEVSPGRSYPHQFMAGTVVFQTEGCWEINAKAGEHATATFIVRVVAAKDATSRP